MKTAILTCLTAASIGGLPVWADSEAETTRQLVALERQAMDGWLKGDPGPAMAILDPDVTWFHIMTETRLDGLAAVKALCESYAGRPLFDSYEIVNPKVQASGDIAVLTYLFVWKTGDTTQRWNSTQVYQRKKEGWRVIHAHWSRTNPPR